MKECDLVMRGGITSGIVYPKAIHGLAETYRFRQIGGASAGAIAAAFAAAAEYGRQTNGFERLNRVPNDLEQGLRNYFQPYPTYRKLFNAVLKLMEKGKSPGVWFFLRNGLRIRRALKSLPSTHFGVCPGTTISEDAGRGLLDWMNRQIEYVAGRMDSPDGTLPEIPLTFGTLKERDVELRLISTNLSQGRPENLPMGRGYRFRLDDLGWLLPGNVADWVRRQSDASGDYIDVPSGENMPVILAVRMSLAFPVLFSAVPLYSRDFSLRVNTDSCQGAAEEQRLNLFSDGGLSSNFPIHYFDAVIPTRPTFGVNLSTYHPCRHGEDDDSGWNRIYLPSEAGGGLTYGINPVPGIGSFLGSLLDTAKDWQDSVQTRMPGYRERIVHVALKEDEGGLNLSMEPDTIRRLIEFGERASERILNGHAQEPLRQPPFSLQVHRWRRLLAATDALDMAIAQMTSAYLAPNPSGDPGIGSMQAFLDDLLRRMTNGSATFGDLGYAPTGLADIRNLKARWDSLVALRQTWKAHGFDPNWNLPSPRAGVKLRDAEF
jgi:predicted acylesterase/phospholipase RssA